MQTQPLGKPPGGTPGTVPAASKTLKDMYQRVRIYLMPVPQHCHHTHPYHTCACPPLCSAMSLVVLVGVVRPCTVSHSHKNVLCSVSPSSSVCRRPSAPCVSRSRAHTLSLSLSLCPYSFVCICPCCVVLRVTLCGVVAVFRRKRL